MNLGNQPVEILIEDIYLLVVPSTESAYNQQEEEDRAQAAKAERLENAELLHMRGQGVQGNGAWRNKTTSAVILKAITLVDGSAQSQGLIQSLISKIVNNLQITVKRIHIRYEDKLSVPGVSLDNALNSTALANTVSSAPVCRWYHFVRIHSSIGERRMGAGIH